MEKYIASFLTALTAIIIFTTAPAVYAQEQPGPGHPAAPSEIVELFDIHYRDSYDKINNDLHENDAAAKEWSEEAFIAKFGINLEDGMDSGYYFEYIDREDPSDIFTAYPTLDEENPWFREVIENEEGLEYGLSGINLLLRKLIPAMQNDPRLLTALDRSTDEGTDTGLWITLRQNEENQSTWYMEFRLKNPDGETYKTYLAWVSASDAAKPVFKVIRKN